ncbi:2-hydroxyacid dehydrogenase [Streptomyces cavernicola]|uniref:2-hydroxyacid dehydrogenase n=1 Tax=Streptomyces cavernicola TaxID=3043613 RepID=A0ABT6SAQ7_9ACTN|nr:2-hydroxyacid dehydrogenase [Streptomyces sp. B-S-A6]MDI3405039.1 2-hydroxyacid dehydrogenase [Streptomyces sp. B-S-A6]
MNTPALRVVIADPSIRPQRERIEAQLPEGAVADWPDPRDHAAVEAAVADADVLVSGVCPAPIATAGKRLRLVHAAGAGTDGIDAAALPPGTIVANTHHHEESIAEYAVASAVLLHRGFLTQDAALRRGDWDTPAYDPAAAWRDSLAGSTVGFVGFGHIGRTAWQRFAAFGTRGIAVTGSGSTQAEAEGLEWAGRTDAHLHPLLEEADTVVVSAPHTPATTGLIGAAELARMKPTAVLVNVGRGPVVDQDALYDALREHTIGAAAIDVWYRYPTEGHHGAPAAHPFHELDNLLMTPHSSALTRQTFQRRADDIAANIRRLAAGQEIERVVTVVPA